MAGFADGSGAHNDDELLKEAEEQYEGDLQQDQGAEDQAYAEGKEAEQYDENIRGLDGGKRHGQWDQTVEEDRSEAKRGRFGPDTGPDRMRGEPGHPPLPRDPYYPADPYAHYDPYLRDPYDPYQRLPPYGYDRLPPEERYGAWPPARSELPPPPEPKPFVPAESIDYAHGGVDREKKVSKPTEVIDYGHGQRSEISEQVSTRERELLLRSQRDYPRGRDGYEDRDRSIHREGRDFSRDRDLEYRSREPDIDMRSYNSERDGSPMRSQRERFESSRLGLDSRERREADYPPSEDRYGDRSYSRSIERGSRLEPAEDSPFGDRYDERRGGDRFDSKDRRANDPATYMGRERDADRLAAVDRDGEGGYGKSASFPGSKRDIESYGAHGSEYLKSRDDDRYRIGSERRGELFPISHSDSSKYSSGTGDPYSSDSRKIDRDRYGRALSPPTRSTPPQGGPAPPILELPKVAKMETVKVEDLICPPGRENRPPHIVTIIRGLPGSGKTYVSKLLREKEIGYGGTPPRMLCLDDYFMVEVEKQVVDPDTGKKVKRKMLEYEYEQALEDAYRQSLLKSFKKTVDDGFFPFIILDATNEKVAHFSEFWSYAKSKGFQVYVGELKVDISTCIQRNIHNWTEWDIEKVKKNWEPLPSHYIHLDLRGMLQEDSIPEVVMEDTDPAEEEEEKEGKEEEEEEEPSGFGEIYKKSKWELDTSEETLDKLDGIRASKKHKEHESFNDYLQLDQLGDEYFSRQSVPGKKRVRWADLEEKEIQNRRRDLGFVVGQTQRDWDRITDDDFAAKALNQTKYFYK